MCIFLYTNTCTYIQTHVMYVQTYRHAHIYTQDKCIFICTHLNIQTTHTHTCRCRCKHTIVPTTDTDAHIYIHIDEHTCIYTLTYIHTHTHTHIGTHTHRVLHTFKPTYLFFSLFIVTIVSSPREIAWKLQRKLFFQRTGV